MPKVTSALRYYGILSVVYLLLIFLLPANTTAQHDYNLTSAKYHLLLFLVILPLIAIWFGAFYSYARLRQYSQAVADTPEGNDFSKLASGFTWLAWASVIAAITSLVMNAVADKHPGFHAAAIITANYISLLIPLVGYTFIGNGAHGLNMKARIGISGNGTKLLMLVFMFLGVAYCYITFSHLNLHSMTTSDNPYYLPAWLMIGSLIIPFLYSWFIGLLAAYELYLYSKHVSGLLYQRAVRWLSIGVIAVIASSIAVQYLRTATPRVGHLSLNTTLLLVNVIYIFMGLGYIVISLGARQLRKIEEV